jgi:hypothetical protein
MAGPGCSSVERPTSGRPSACGEKYRACRPRSTKKSAVETALVENRPLAAKDARPLLFSALEPFADLLLDDVSWLPG